MIKKVVLWSNEVVDVCDENGAKIDLFVGKLADILTPLLKETGADTKFALSFFGIGEREVPRDEWEAQAKYFIQRNR